MIDKKVVKQFVDEWLQDDDYFLVDITIRPDDKIVVEVDRGDGVGIEDCVVLKQYINHIGKEVEVLDNEGKKTKGVLKSVDGSDFVVSYKEKTKKEGAKRPVLTEVDKTFNMNNIKYTKYLISFK